MEEGARHGREDRRPREVRQLHGRHAACFGEGGASKKMRTMREECMIRFTMKLGNFFAHLGGRKRDAGEEPARFAAPASQPANSAPSFPYHAVSVKPGLMSCSKATKLRGVRMLSRQAPSIPLSGCTMPHECTCRFQKHNDRRQGDRRLFGSDPDARFFSGSERRRVSGRRATDSRPQSN
jgi:hypothetical protein